MKKHTYKTFRATRKKEVKAVMDKVKNLRDIIDVALAEEPEATLFMVRNGEKIRNISRLEFTTQVKNLAIELMLKDCKCCAIVGENSYKWNVCYFAAIYANAIVVPVDKDLTNIEISTIVKSSGADILLWGESHDDIIEPILESGITNLFYQSDNSTRVRKNSIEEAMEKGAELLKTNPLIFDNIEVNPNSVYSYVFTSGTTGTSKGVMLSHGNIIANLFASIDMDVVGPRSLAILPMNHTFHTTLGLIFSMVNGSIIAINNSIKQLSQNFKLFKPTDLPCVPLVVEIMHSNIWKTIRESKKERAVRLMMKLSRGLIYLGIDIRKTLFKKIHDSLGGEFRTFFAGGALLDAQVARDMNDFGFNICIGYGITECSPLIAGNVNNEYSKFGSCGFSATCNQIKIVDQNENGEGEILVKGGNVMLGYLNNPEATNEVFDNGWYRTGDIGRTEKSGHMYITGRKKNLIVLQNGKNIYPEEIEGFVTKYNEVKEALAFAGRNEKGQEMSVSIEIFPDFDYAEEKNIKDIEAEIRKIIEEVNSKLPYYKRIVDVTFRDCEFEKTTTKKIKRYKK